MTTEPGDREHAMNQALIAALHAAREEPTSTTLATLYQALVDSTLVLPVPEELLPEVAEVPEFETEDEGEAPIPLVTFEDDQGASMLIAFTDEDAALAWEPEGMAYIALRGLDLVLLAVEHSIDSIVLNPESADAWELQQPEIAALAQGQGPAGEITAPAAPHQGVTVLISPPDEEPPASWKDAVKEILAGYPSIEAAYFFELHLPPAGTRPVIGLALYREMSAAAQDRLVEAVLAEFTERLPEDLTLEFVILDDDDFRRSVREAVPALYSRPAVT